ncbi:hypothetical protein EXIGLDRAFT_759732 [Exidia glandulosa HHB12029]|uniref:Uncharacterized protein n=1 Tax=Exidia glandulosa HHB12029 TaxID=1314781 RepID=A0A165PSF2_EXIGL|nr:hypothetical protein EXIGLDRAFT_759732 [Exidia glandulosa HHB12029]
MESSSFSSIPYHDHVQAPAMDTGTPGEPRGSDLPHTSFPGAALGSPAHAHGGEIPLPQALPSWPPAHTHYASAHESGALDNTFASQHQQNRYVVMPWDLVQPMQDDAYRQLHGGPSGDLSPFDPTPAATSSATSPPESPPAFDVAPFYMPQYSTPADVSIAQPGMNTLVDSGRYFEHEMHVPDNISHHNFNEPITYGPVAAMQPHMFDAFEMTSVHTPSPTQSNFPEYRTSYAPDNSSFVRGMNVELPADEFTPSPPPPPPALPLTIDLTVDSPPRFTEPLLLADENQSQQPYPPGSRRIPPRTLELRIMSEAELTRMNAGERRRIYISSLETHLDRLYASALAVGKHECNRGRITQLSGMDTKTLRITTSYMQEELDRLRDVRDALKAKKIALRTLGAAPVPAPSLPPGPWS